MGKLSMQIHLKVQGALTLGSVRALIGSKDDSQHRQLRVTKDGIAYLSDKVGFDDIDELAFRFETWNFGNGYCGTDAALDDKWVEEVFRDLKENWPNPKSEYIGI